MSQNELAIRRRAEAASFDDAWTAPIPQLKRDLAQDDREMRIIRRIRRWEDKLNR